VVNVADEKVERLQVLYGYLGDDGKTPAKKPAKKATAKKAASSRSEE
jgi:hypothetical protein